MRVSNISDQKQRKKEEPLQDGISVLMAVHLGDDVKLFSRALESVWCDQQLEPNEIVLVVDGEVSTDVEAVFSEWQKKLGAKLQVLKLRQNVGLARALNKGLSACRFCYIGRMDADDVSMPERFKLQKEYLDSHANIVTVGGHVEEVDRTNKRKNDFRRLPLDPYSLRRFASYRNPLSHPTVLMRTQIIQDLGGYPEFRKCQDYALWGKLLSKGYEIANLDRVLVKMDAGEGLIRRRNLKHWCYEANVFFYLANIGFISRFASFKNIILRLIARMMPLFLRRIIYKKVRS